MQHAVVALAVEPVGVTDALVCVSDFTMFGKVQERGPSRWSWVKIRVPLGGIRHTFLSLVLRPGVSSSWSLAASTESDIVMRWCVVKLGWIW